MCSLPNSVCAALPETPAAVLAWIRAKHVPDPQVRAWMQSTPQPQADTPCSCATCNPHGVMVDAARQDARTERRLTWIALPLVVVLVGGCAMVGAMLLAWRILRGGVGFVRYRLGCAWRGEWKEAWRVPGRRKGGA